MRVASLFKREGLLLVGLGQGAHAVGREKLVFIQDISQKPDQTFLRRNGQEAHVGAVAVRGTPFHIGHVRGKIATRLVVQEPLHARAKTGEAINNRFVQYVNGKQGYESDH